MRLTCKAVRFFLFSAILLALPLGVCAQDVEIRTSVERVSGIQVGAFGVWIYREGRLADVVAFRMELGLDGVFRGVRVFETNGAVTDRIIFLMTPMISLEPRWYYNINRRFNALRPVADNSADFLALRFYYRPNWSAVSNDGLNYEVPNTLGLAPVWAIRRNIGPYFNYEVGLGLGAEFSFSSLGTAVSLLIAPQLRIGYRFGSRTNQR